MQGPLGNGPILSEHGPKLPKGRRPQTALWGNPTAAFAFLSRGKVTLHATARKALAGKGNGSARSHGRRPGCREDPRPP